METKICKKCNEIKMISEFHKQRDSKDGYKNQCKKCRSQINKLYNDSNKDKKKENNKSYRESNKEKISLYRKEYNLKNKSKIREYNNLNRDKLNLRRREYTKRRNEKDPFNKLKHNLRNIIYKSIIYKGHKKNNKTEMILGISFQDFKIYLESKFEPWMTWDNHGLYNGDFKYGWDIDHIIPLSSAESELDLIRLNHYSNLQPLCSKINRDIKRCFEVF